MTATRTVTEREMSYYERLPYEVAPEDHGQAVEVSYCYDDGEVVRRIEDRGDGTVTYQVAQMTDEEISASEYHSIGGMGRPDVSGEWQTITLEMDEDEDEDDDE